MKGIIGLATNHHPNDIRGSSLSMAALSTAVMLHNRLMKVTGNEWELILIDEHHVFDDELTDDILWSHLVDKNMTFAEAQQHFDDAASGTSKGVVVWLHSDASATEDAVNHFVDCLVALEGKRWGVLLTKYDAISARSHFTRWKVGRWDKNIPWYLADNDYYHRVRIANLPIIEIGEEGVTHPGSSSTVCDWRMQHQANVTHNLSRIYYNWKWGDPGNERRVPFNGQYLLPDPSHFRAQLAENIKIRLMNCYETIEGTLFERHEHESIMAQCKAIAWAYERAGRPWGVVETGTAKGMFGLLLGLLNPYASLMTIDGDERTRASVEILESQNWLASIHHLVGDSKVLLTEDVLGWTKFAWVDGGHDEVTATHDITTCMKAGVEVIVVDDTVMPEVRRAIDNALALHRNYVEIENPFIASDVRKIAILELCDA